MDIAIQTANDPIDDESSADRPEGASELDEDEGEAEDSVASDTSQDPEAPASDSRPQSRTPELPDEELERALAALLFASSEPLTAARLAKLAGDAPAPRVRASLARLGERLVSSGLPFELCEIARGWQLRTVPETAEYVARLVGVRKDEKVSPASLETLAIVAYRQPVTKAEVEAIRGVQVGPVLRALVDRGLVRVAGRADVPGHPLLYGTTQKFLETFGLASLVDLPRDSELLRDS